MNKKLLITMSALAAAALISMPVQAQEAGNASSAIDAFNAFVASSDNNAKAADASYGHLDNMMNGSFSNSSTEDAASISEKLGILCSISNRELASYASFKGYKVSKVRNTYYKTLASVLSDHIRLNPSSEAKYANVQKILALFLEKNPDSADMQSRAELRSQMTPEYITQMANDYSLPASFVEFVIMDDDWDDDDFDNDYDWMARTGWGSISYSGADSYGIGSSDSQGSTYIADMQDELINLGYLSGKADGVFGPRTQAALYEFQLANGLKATGSYSAPENEMIRSNGAVARWDYDDDFWDMYDYNTPDYNTPDYITPEYYTPDYYTPDYYGYSANNGSYQQPAATPAPAATPTPAATPAPAATPTPAATPAATPAPASGTSGYYTPDYYTPDYITPDYHTPDYVTPDYHTPDYNTPDYNTPD